MDTRPAGLTIAQAAEALGVSEKTVRRRLKAGKLQAEQVLTPQGHVWLISLDRRSAPSPGQTDLVTDQDMHRLARAVADELTRTLTWPASTQLDQLTEQVRTLSDQVRELREQLALDAPKEETDTGQAEQDAPRRAWWRFWR